MNVKPKTVKLIEGNRKKFYNFELSKDFSGMTQKNNTYLKSGNIGLHQISKLLLFQRNLEWRDQPLPGENICKACV